MYMAEEMLLTSETILWDLCSIVFFLLNLYIQYELSYGMDNWKCGIFWLFQLK